MMTDSEYLWDRSGPPDCDVVELERLLGSLRHHPSAAAVRVRTGAVVFSRALVTIAAMLLLRRSRSVRRALREVRGHAPGRRDDSLDVTVALRRRIITRPRL
jgi:hypothetical protein